MKKAAYPAAFRNHQMTSDTASPTDFAYATTCAFASGGSVGGKASPFAKFMANNLTCIDRNGPFWTFGEGFSTGETATCVTRGGS